MTWLRLRLKRVTWRVAVCLSVWIGVTVLPLPDKAQNQLRDAALAGATAALVDWTSRQLGKRRGKRPEE
jgi:hypothetical protein